VADQLLYGELAPWFHLLTRPEDYAQEAAYYREVLGKACSRPPRTVLELGSGGGNNASHMKAWFEMTLVDLSPRMLETSRGLNPELEHIEGDMCGLRLGREFDAVFIHDAIAYMTSRQNLAAAVRTAAAHCRPGGAVLLCPDCTRETFRPYSNRGGHDGEDGRALRYLEWAWDPDPDDETYQMDFAVMLREADGSMRHVQDRVTLGLFSRAVWLQTLEDEGLEAGAVEDPNAEERLGGCELFLGLRKV
jgi:SAM-dependent methyltransferase